jgi:hypothetical protein
MASIHSSTTRLAVVIACAAALQGCVTTANFSSTTPGSTLAIKGIARTELPRSEELESKATKQYEFVVTPPQGEPIYGILPLRTNGGKIAASVLFFAPALFIGGFRDPYGFYEFDPVNNHVRYKVQETDEWILSAPSKAQSDRAKASFAVPQATAPVLP